MKRFFLLRHGHAENTYANDFQRKLTQEGIKKCIKVGEILSDYKVDIILSSDSVRTKETVENLKLPSSTIIEYQPKLYKSNAKQLLNVINDALYQYNTILLVNHNPAISELGMLLSDDEDIQQGFSPASLALFQDMQLMSFWR